MGAHDLLSRLRNAGLILAAEGDGLMVFPRELLTDAMRAEVRNNKMALLEALKPCEGERCNEGVAVQDGGADDRIVCDDCLYFRPHGLQCRNHWVAGLPRELGSDLANKPQCCPGFSARPH